MSIVNLLTDWDFEDYTGWGLSVTLPNWVSYHVDYNNSYTKNTSRRLLKTVAGSCKTFQTIDLGVDISGRIFSIGGWVKIATCDAGGGALLYYQWLNGAGDVIGSDNVIATLSATQAYTLHYDDACTAPAGAEQIKYWFEVTGGALNVTAYLDNVFVYGPYNYGLKVYDTAGNNSLITSEVSSIISSGTVSMPDTLQDDGTYGVDIDLPGTDYIDTKNIGVIIQVRDFAWKLIVNILTYDSGKKFWGNFFGDSSITYYEKSSVDGVMTTFAAGNMTPGDQSTYNPLITLDLNAVWDRYATSITSVRLFSALFYTFLKAVGAGTTVYTLYARNYGITTNGVTGYMLSTGQGSTEKDSGAMQSSAGYTIHYSTETYIDVSIVHSDLTETSLATGVADHLWEERWGGDGSREGQRTGTWACPGVAEENWATTDALKFRLHIILKARYWPLGMGEQTITGYLDFVTGQLGWRYLEATTWTITRYLYVHQEWWNQGKVTVRIYWGTSSKEVNISNIEAGTFASSNKRVCSIGSNGVSEIDYMIYQKNYDGS